MRSSKDDNSIELIFHLHETTSFIRYQYTCVLKYSHISRIIIQVITNNSTFKLAYCIPNFDFAEVTKFLSVYFFWGWRRLHFRGSWY